MIIRPQRDDLILIAQADHAALSRTIMEHWRLDDLMTRSSRATILQALEQHDNGWNEADASPTVDPETGSPHDFITAPDTVKRAVWPRAIARIAPREPLVAALIAQHALTVNRRHRDERVWQRFFTAIETDLNRLLAVCRVTTGADRQRFDRDYDAVRLGDMLSLIFCNGWRERFDIEAGRVWLEQDTLSIIPGPFGDDEVSFSVAGRKIPNRLYQSDVELHAVLNNAPQVTIRGQARAALL